MTNASRGPVVVSAMALLLLMMLGPALVHSNGIHDVDGNIIDGLAPEEIAVGAHGKLSDRPSTIPLYKSLSPSERASTTPPYVPPKDNKYNTGGGPVPGKINVHLVPHTHDDTGWQVTVDQYFYREVYYIVDTVIQNLLEDPNRKFIYVETGFFARWWDEASPEKRNATRTLVERGQLEFINGGWCMHDEASPKWEAMVDQTTRGHQFLLKNFGPKANPRGTNTFVSLLRERALSHYFPFLSLSLSLSHTRQRVQNV